MFCDFRFLSLSNIKLFGMFSPTALVRILDFIVGYFRRFVSIFPKLKFRVSEKLRIFPRLGVITC